MFRLWGKNCVEYHGFISMDGVSGLEEGAAAIFPGTVVQRCIIHLLRNSMLYIPWNKSREFLK